MAICAPPSLKVEEGFPDIIRALVPSPPERGAGIVMRALSEERCDAVIVTLGALGGARPVRVAMWQPEKLLVLWGGHTKRLQGPG